MALVVHSGVAAIDLSNMATTYIEHAGSASPAYFEQHQVEHWEVLSGVYVGEMLNLNGQFYQVLSISGRDMTVGRTYLSMATSYVTSTSTRHGVYLSNTLQIPKPKMVGPPPDLEPPVWPLWLASPPPGEPSPVCLEIPAVGDMIFNPEYRGGERVDPMIRETPSETATRKARERQAMIDWQAMEVAEQKSQRWKFWRRKVG